MRRFYSVSAARMGNKCAPNHQGEYQQIPDEEGIPVAVAVEADSCDVRQITVAEATTVESAPGNSESQRRLITYEEDNRRLMSYEEEQRRMREEEDAVTCFLIVGFMIYLIFIFSTMGS